MHHKQGRVHALYDYYPDGLMWSNVRDDQYDNTFEGSEFAHGEWGISGLNMNYFEARWYDPTLGRWHSPDPLEQFHSAYVGIANDPANFIDPDGRNAREWIKSHKWELENLGKGLLLLGAEVGMIALGELSASSRLIISNTTAGLAMAKTAADGIKNHRKSNQHSFDPNDEMNMHGGVGMSYRGASNEQEQSFDDEEAQEEKSSDSPNDGFENCTPPNGYEITICNGKVEKVEQVSTMGGDETDYITTIDLSYGPLISARTLTVIAVKEVTINGGEVLNTTLLKGQGFKNVSLYGAYGRFPGVRETIVTSSPALQESINPIELFIGMGFISFSRNLLKVGVKCTAEGGAKLSTNGAKLSRHLGQLEKYGQGGFKELPNGRFRYYGKIQPATKAGEMQGARLVREWNPANGNTRTWYETLDHSGMIRQVHPKYNNLPHFKFDASGIYIGKENGNKN